MRISAPLQEVSRSTQPVGFLVDVKDGPQLLLLDALVLEHAVVHPGVLALDAQGGLGDDGLEDEVVVAVGAVLVGLLELLDLLAEALAALLAGEHHLEGGLERVRLALVVALGAVEPLPAAGAADRHLGVEDVFAAGEVGLESELN